MWLAGISCSLCYYSVKSWMWRVFPLCSTSVTNVISISFDWRQNKLDRSAISVFNFKQNIQRFTHHWLWRQVLKMLYTVLGPDLFIWLFELSFVYLGTKRFFMLKNACQCPLLYHVRICTIESHLNQWKFTYRKYSHIISLPNSFVL